jgi:HSP20 family protein
MDRRPPEDCSKSLYFRRFRAWRADGIRLAGGFSAVSGSLPDAKQTNSENNIMNQSTMTIHPWGSLTALRDLQREMSRLFEGGLSAARTARYPLVNLLSDSNQAIVTAEIPGVDPADLEISLTKGQLTIRGSVKDGAPEGEGVVCHRKERGTGPFARTFALPFEVEEETISAKYEKGVLAITLPRAEKSKPRTIPVIAN